MLQAWVLISGKKASVKSLKESLVCRSWVGADPCRVFPASLSLRIVKTILRRLLIESYILFSWWRVSGNIYRRLMLCPVFLCAVFLQTAGAWPHTASYWACMCWSLSPHSMCLLYWKGLTRVRGQNTAFEQVLKFRTGEHKKKNNPWKDFIFCWNLRKLKYNGNTNEIYTENTATSCTKLNIFILKDSDFSL